MQLQIAKVLFWGLWAGVVALLPTVSLSEALHADSGKRLGLAMGYQTTKNALLTVQDIGSWYYMYDPYPTRTGRLSTLAMAKASGKEFVPMISEHKFYLDESHTAYCVFVQRLVAEDAPLCDTATVQKSLKRMLGEFSGHAVKPRYLMFDNEPWTQSPDTNATWNGQNVKVTPWQAASKMVIVQPAADRLGLTLVSPTADQKGVWISEFLKQCVQMPGCDINKIQVISVHKYVCSRKSWQEDFVERKWQARLLERVKDSGNGMTPEKWADYINTRRIWVTETNCNGDPDYRRAAQQPDPQYPIRTQEEFCLRASGQENPEVYGSLQELLSMDTSNVERVSWWVAYASKAFAGRKQTDSRVDRNDRIDWTMADRMVEENGNELTPVGRLIAQAYADPTRLGKVDCAN